MPRRALYVTAWVATTAAATVVGLGAVGFVRAASGDPTVRPLSQEQVGAELAQVAAGSATPDPPAPAATAGASARAVTPTPRSTASARPSSAPRASATRSSPPSPTARATRSATPTTSTVRAAFSSPGGSVVAECRGDSAYLVSWSPSGGYVVDEVERGPAEDAKVRFANGEQRVTIEIRCSGGRPVAEVEADEHD